MGIAHVRLSMPAGADAAAIADHFYGTVLGLDRIEAGDATTPVERWYRSGGVTLRLAGDEPDRTPVVRGHAALFVDDVGELSERLRDGDHEPAGRLVVDDPFGNQLELIETTDPPPEVFRIVADTALNPFALVTREGVIRWIGSSITELLGRSPDELIGQPLDAIVAGASLPVVIEALEMLDDVPRSYPRAANGLPIDLVRNDGTPTPCDVFATNARKTGLPWHVVFARRTGYDRALDRALEAMADDAELTDVLANLSEAVEQAIPQSRVAIGVGWYGSGFELAAGGAREMLQPDPGAPWSRAMARGSDVIAPSLDDLPAGVRSVAGDHGMSSCWVHPVAIPGEPGPEAAVVVWREFSGKPTGFTSRTLHRAGQLLRLTLQWHRSHRSLEFAATHDPLTGVANRQAFRDRLGAVVKADDGRAAVLFVDLDNFKPVNDELGHLVGDHVLKEVAGRLITALRPGDLVARIGGDEFAVLCERLTRPDDVIAVAERLLAVIREPIGSAVGVAGELQIDASIGVTAVFPHESADTVVARADLAMREAKTTGRGHWVHAGS